jgi:dynactin complex subunit
MSSAAAADSLARVGTRVCVKNKSGTVGIVRFVGSIKAAAGTWVGVELDDPDGRNDGTLSPMRVWVTFFVGKMHPDRCTSCVCVCVCVCVRVCRSCHACHS